MMLPQEVKTPLVPDSAMSSTMGPEEYKRKAGPNALAAPDAKKRSTSAGLPIEVKTPLVPESEMSSTMGPEEYKRKAGPGALAAPDAKKRATSTGLPIEDKTPQEVSSECSKELDYPESDAESEVINESESSDDKIQLLDPLLTTGPDVEANIRFTSEPGDFEPLHAALAQSFAPDTAEYKKRFEKASALQESYEEMGIGPLGLLRVHVAFHKDGQAFGGAACI